jgi:hypothetical protein
MSRFSLKETTLTIRDTQVRVRELTHAERTKFINSEKLAMLSIVASMGTVDPPMTVEQAADEPAGVVEEIVENILALSGMGKKNGAVLG